MDKIRRETQGHKKLQQYIADLRRNRHFIAKIKKIKVLSKITNTNDKEQAREFENFWKKYKELIEPLKKGSQKWKLWQLYDELAEKYGLDNDLLMNIEVSQSVPELDSDELGQVLDFCALTDSYDEFFNPELEGIPFELNARLQRHIRAYPISLDIHKFASKRDVLDYIEKNWDIIESFLENYRSKKVRFRTRKIDRKITDFIWGHKNLSLKKLKDELDKAHPHNGLAYYEIGKVISIEKRRRTKKLSVGQ